MAKKKKGLGRGLGALIGPSVDLEEAPAAVEQPGQPGQAEQPGDGSRVLLLNPHDIRPNPKQPRTTFVEDALEELAESIRRNGVQEPIIVRRVEDRYELVSGERRVRASIMAEQETVPAICRDVSDTDMLRLGLIENIHREDLNPIELAEAYEKLVAEFGWTQEELATEVGKKRVTVTNTLRLLNLPADVQDYVQNGSLTMGHAKALLAIETPDGQRQAARKIITEGLSVREAEKLASPPKPKVKKPPEPKDPNVAQLEDGLRKSLGTKVTLHTLKGQRGRIEIEYYSYDDLERILEHLRGRG